MVLDSQKLVHTAVQREGEDQESEQVGYGH
jgi:hypothetical protein